MHALNIIFNNGFGVKQGWGSWYYLKIQVHIHLLLPTPVSCLGVCLSCQSNLNLAVKSFLEYQVLSSVTGGVEWKLRDILEAL